MESKPSRNNAFPLSHDKIHQLTRQEVSSNTSECRTTAQSDNDNGLHLGAGTGGILVDIVPMQQFQITPTPVQKFGECMFFLNEFCC